MPRKTSSKIFRVLVCGATLLTVSALAFVVGYIVVMGVPNIRPDLFSVTYTSENVSLLPALVNTLIMVVLAVSVGSVFGIGAAVFLEEYARRDSLFIRAIVLATETLSGIPSIVYGLFGLLFFVYYLKWGLSLLAGAATLSIMIFPIIMRATQEALKSVPVSYREGSFGLGAGRFRTVMKVVIPPAIPGILGGMILGMGRVVGESAALIYTAGSIAAIPDSVFDSTRTLAVHMYVLASEGLHLDATYATAVVLLVFVLALNLSSSFIARKVSGASNAE